MSVKEERWFQRAVRKHTKHCVYREAQFTSDTCTQIHTDTTMFSVLLTQVSCSYSKPSHKQTHTHTHKPHTDTHTTHTRTHKRHTHTHTSYTHTHTQAINSHAQTCNYWQIHIYFGHPVRIQICELSIKHMWCLTYVTSQITSLYMRRRGLSLGY